MVTTNWRLHTYKVFSILTAHSSTLQSLEHVVMWISIGTFYFAKLGFIYSIQEL